MSNPTALAFGYPDNKVAETDHWLVLVRPKQPTFGSLVLVYKDRAEAFSDLSPAAFSDLKLAIDGIERLLRQVVAYEKINYLMLMMVDRDVHFHVIPRYSGERVHAGRAFVDAGWPAAPALGATVDLDAAAAADLAALLAKTWSAA
ncbi:HIT family protein [Caulobacter henricii]|uniref:HIT family hydrolase n=1 Tax=Caulobacter henricii TaxID=69395 RepID=A0A0P0NYQ5_9CAUL|nr:HIT family protein [Caulobacter henricii]ALL13237.1 HIT family hydrolase [Caulobacter henricii]